MKRASMLLVLFFFAGGMSAYADIVPYTDPSGQGTQNFGGNLALTFTVNSPITVDALGVFNASGTGFITGSISVAIYDTDTSTVVTPVETFSGQYTVGALGFDVFQSISPVVLGPGNYEVDAVGFSDSDNNGNLNTGSSGPLLDDIGGSITFTGAAYSSSPTLNYPSGLGTCSGCASSPAVLSQFDAGTFSVEQPLAATPEPGFYEVFGGLGAGMIGLLFATRRRRVAS